MVSIVHNQDPKAFVILYTQATQTLLLGQSNCMPGAWLGVIRATTIIFAILSRQARF